MKTILLAIAFAVVAIVSFIRNHHQQSRNRLSATHRFYPESYSIQNDCFAAPGKSTYPLVLCMESIKDQRYKLIRNDPNPARLLVQPVPKMELYNTSETTMLKEFIPWTSEETGWNDNTHAATMDPSADLAPYYNSITPLSLPLRL